MTLKRAAYVYTRPVDLGRRHLAYLRRRIAAGDRERIAATRPPYDPTAALHIVQLAAVYPSDCRIARCYDTHVHQATLGIAKGHGEHAPRWLGRARAAGCDPEAEPVLLWEDVCWDWRVEPTAQAQLLGVRLGGDWTLLGTAILHVAADAVVEVVVAGGATAVRLSLDDGDPVDLGLEAGRAWTEARYGSRLVRVWARGPGDLDAAAVQVGLRVLVERWRRYTAV